MISGFMDSEKQLPGKEAHSRQADVYDLMAWIEVNKKKVAVAAVLAVVVGFSVAIYRNNVQEKELKASDALLALKPALLPSTNTPTAPPEAFFKVADDFKGTSAAERAQYYGATLLFSENKYADAEAQFSRFLKEHEGSPWAPAATFGIAAAQEAKGKPEALASYQNVFARYPQSPEAEQAKLAVARIYEARNQPDQALRIYNELTASKPGTASSMANPELLQKKEALLRKYPNLNTNTATTAVSSFGTNAVSTNVLKTNTTTLSLPTNAAAAQPTGKPGANTPAPATSTVPK
jgi:TolA-binding protein